MTTDLAKLKEAAEKADPSLTRGASEAQVEKIIRAGMATVPYSGKADYAADAAYIVAACRAVPGLLTRLSAAESAHASALARVAVLEGALREIAKGRTPRAMHDALSRTPALALCAAILRAKEQGNGDE